MSRTIPDRQQLVKEIEAEVFSGSLPSWMTASGAGTVTAEDASNDGGRWVVDPGTAATGDEETLGTTFDLDATAYDIIELECRIRMTTNTNNDGVFTVSLLDGANSNGLQYSYLNGGTHLNERLAKLVSGARSSVTAPEQNDTQEHRVVLRWNIAEDTAVVFIDGMPSNELDVSDLPGNAYRAEFYTKYNGGNACQLEVYDFGLRYYRLPNAP